MNNKNNKYVKSHIQVSRLLLKNFSFRKNIQTKKGIDKSPRVYYLDLQTQKISEEKINDIDSKFAYYNPMIEEYLAELETKVGEIFAIVKNYDKKSVTLNKENIETIKDFFEYAIIRSPKTLSDVNKQSKCTKIFGNASHSFIINLFKSNKKLKMFEEYFPNILINDSDIPFILPKCIMYGIQLKKEKYPWFIMPIKNNIAIILQHKDCIKKYLNNGTMNLVKTEQNNLICLLNDIALKNEQSQNNKFLISSINGLDELKRLQQSLKTRKNENQNN